MEVLDARLGTVDNRLEAVEKRSHKGRIGMDVSEDEDEGGS